MKSMTSCSIETSVLQDIELAAKAMKKSRSELINEAVKQWLYGNKNLAVEIEHIEENSRLARDEGRMHDDIFEDTLISLSGMKKMNKGCVV